jgi:WD40 repeat protein
VTTGAPSSPFKGLNAFEDSEIDALLFFGREREREIVAANLTASRLTVLYGPSGVGKSSLLRAAVARSLRALPEEPLVVVFSRWSHDPGSALAEAVSNADGAERNGSAFRTLEHAQTQRDVYLILDQAEEYFLYHADDAGPESFAETLPAVLSGLYRVNVLVSLREDSLAKLDRFTGRIPGLFANTLRLDRLDRDAARAAIVRPVERFAELTHSDVTVEPSVVERVLDEVGAGQIETALGGRGSVEGEADSVRIEAPYLQLVMQRLWDEERAAGSAVLRVATLERLGGAQHIVEEHLEGAMDELTADEKDVAARLFNHLVTPSGTKIAHDVSDLADFGQVTADVLRPVLATLSARRILRSIEEAGGVRYEIFHDVLAQPVLAWRARHRTERELERKLVEAHKRRRRFQLLFGLVLIALALMSAITAFALSQRSEARSKRAEADERTREAKTAQREAKARELDSLARAYLDSDPELGLLFAREAAKRSPTDVAEDTLRAALEASGLRAVVRFGEPLVGAMKRGSNFIGVTAAGSVMTADRDGRIRETVKTGVEARAASFSEDGHVLVAGTDGRIRLVDPGGSVSRIPGITRSRGAEVSTDGRLALVWNDGGAFLIDVHTGALLHSFERPATLAAAMSRDGRVVATAHSARTVRLWDVATGIRFQKLQGHFGSIVAIALSPRGDFVAAADSDGIAQVWTVANGTQVAVLTGHENALTDIAFSRNGREVVTASEDRTVRVWNVATSHNISILRGHNQRVTFASFNGLSRGPTIISASRDKTARTWLHRFTSLRRLASVDAPVVHVEFAENGRVIRATASDRLVHVLNSTTGKQLASFKAKRRSTTVRDPYGATATTRRHLVVLRSHGRTMKLKGHSADVTSVAFSPDSKLLATASLDADVRIWNAATGHLKKILSGHLGPVQDAQFSPDGRWVVTGGSAQAGLWFLRTGERLTFLRGNTEPIASVAFDPASRMVVTGSVDGTVRTYRCDLCGDLEHLVALATRRLATTGRTFTPAERQRYLG